MHLKDPFALMTLASSYSGLRAGELPVLRKSDDLGDFLHVHRQQRKEIDENGHQFFYELPHTKDERRHPHNGRLVPITPELREILDHANNLPGKSEYTFHNKESLYWQTPTSKISVVGAKDSKSQLRITTLSVLHTTAS